MIRTLLWLLAGLLLGAVIHIAVILGLPALASDSIWDRVTALSALSALSALDKPVVLPAVKPGEANPLRLDPELAYAVCQIDLRKGPGTLSGTLPDAFWSLAVYGKSGTVIYSTTNRDSVGQRLDLGIFNPVQTRLLAEQKLDVAEGLLIVEAQEDDIFVVVRLAPAHQVMRARYEAALGQLACGNLQG